MKSSISKADWDDEYVTEGDHHSRLRFSRLVLNSRYSNGQAFTH